MGWTQTLTQLIVDGCVDDLISCNVAIGLCRFCPANLSDSWADDIKGQAPRFTRHWRKQNRPRVISSNLALLSQNSLLITKFKLFAPHLAPCYATVISHLNGATLQIL